LPMGSNALFDEFQPTICPESEVVSPRCGTATKLYIPVAPAKPRTKP
jgi:hypothetical protein